MQSRLRDPAAVGLLVLEMQFALARKEKLPHRAAELADLGWVDGGGDQVAAVPCRLVYEGVDGHRTIMPNGADG